MIDITKIIAKADYVVWDNKVISEGYWIENDLISECMTKERFRQTLYVHVLKNDTNDSVWDNNGKIDAPGGRSGTKNPKKVIFPRSYMIKFGKATLRSEPNERWKGIISRRQDDFRNHYHTRDNIEHPVNIQHKVD